MCRKRSEAQGTGRGSEKGARDAGKHSWYFRHCTEAGNKEQYRRNYFIDPEWDVQRKNEENKNTAERWKMWRWKGGGA